MTSNPTGNTPDQGADRSADRKPREVRDLIKRLLACAVTREAETEGRFVSLSETKAMAAGYRKAAAALAAQDARIKELEKALGGIGTRNPYGECRSCLLPTGGHYPQCSLAKVEAVLATAPKVST